MKERSVSYREEQSGKMSLLMNGVLLVFCLSVLAILSHGGL